MNIYDILHNDWWGAWIGLCALAVLAALIRSISEQKRDVLPEPRCDCVDRGPLEHWEAQNGHVRHP